MTPLIGNVPLTLKSRLTLAFVVVDEVLTGSVVAARSGQTLVILCAAVLSRVARLAPALKAARLVATNPKVADIFLWRNVRQTVTASSLPIRGAALINVQLTVVSLPARGTGALVSAHQVAAIAPVLAGAGRALVHVLAAVGSPVAQWTGTFVVVDEIKAFLVGFTLCRSAIIDVVLALGAIKAELA